MESENGNILLDSIVTRLQAICENLKKVLKHNKGLMQKYPNIEWEKIIRFRDLVSHHYEKLDYEVVFDICQSDLPELKKTLTEELNS